ncbi:MAG: hypothetical protein GXO92_02340 [FCB group bacterium]|nr:hypothetical protein [FCB group bacterium]
MNKLKQYIQHQKTITPPQAIREELVEKVMDRINKEPKFGNHPLWQWTVAAGTLILIGVLLLSRLTITKTSYRDDQDSQLAVESIIIMDNHTAFWLEPLNNYER